MSKDHYFEYEEDYHSDERKADRKERKRIVSRDRSKYKKTDQDQLKKRADAMEAVPMAEGMLRGRVLAIAPEGIFVDCAGTRFVCNLKGALKKDKSRIKNLVAVGDYVWVQPSGETEGVVTRVEERSSVLSRADHLYRTKEQLIAVNIDQVLITCSVLAPPLKPFLIDRYIIAAQKGRMTPVILINKVDLLDTPPPDVADAVIQEERALYEQFLQTYRALGIPVIPLSCATGQGIAELKTHMAGKTSVFSGQSGVGKSSLINLITGTHLPTGELVQKTLKGAHTTTTTHLVRLEGESFCIDTPGIRSFGLWDLKAEEINAYFTEIQERGAQCKFPDCGHLSEPDCAVQNALEHGEISPLRFASYCALMASLEEEHRIR